MLEETKLPEITQSFVIKRSEWLRGEGSALSKLFRKRDGKKCCLGIYLLSCGISSENLLEQLYPVNLVQKLLNVYSAKNSEIEKFPERARWLLGISSKSEDESWVGNSSIASFLARTNDDQVLSGKDRESEIISIFRQNGVAVTIVD